MNGEVGTDEGSVVEYSLSELGFILVFVLLLLSGWEINDFYETKNTANRTIVELEGELRSTQEPMALLQEVVKKATVDQEWSDEMILISKSEWFSNQEELSNLKELTSNNLPEIVDDESTLDAKASESIDDGLLAGAVGFCTYEPPATGSSKLYGKSVALGTMVVGEDYLMLIGKNTSIESSKLVDMAGISYDTSAVWQELEKWPMNVKLTPTEFLERGRKFVQIGDIPSPQRVECRFGMDYFKAAYSKEADFNFEKIFNNVFYRHSEISEESYFSLYANNEREIFETGANKRDIVVTDRNSAEAVPDYLEGRKLLPELLEKFPPDYPERAYRRKVPGTVILEYFIDEFGYVKNIVVVEEVPLGYKFGDEAKKALRRYRFSPAMRNDESIISEVQRKKFTFKP